MTVDKDNCDKYSIGDRIVYDDSIGTVKFIGELQSVKGIKRFVSELRINN